MYRWTRANIYMPEMCVNGIHINPCPNYHLNNVERSECMVNQFKQTQTSLYFIKKTILHKKFCLTLWARMKVCIQPGAPWHQCTSLSPVEDPMEEGQLPVGYCRVSIHSRLGLTSSSMYFCTAGSSTCNILFIIITLWHCHCFSCMLFDCKYYKR